MLSYFVTDARFSAEQLKNFLHEAVNLSFNMVSVDTDTSTSDTVATESDTAKREAEA